MICEGRETEPNYIRGLCQSHRINMANVRVWPGCTKTDAVSLVESARARFEADPEYDAVYVVCDDERGLPEKARTLAARPMTRRDGGRMTVTLVRSRPCIEFWLLLHFEHSSRPYRSATEVMVDLRRHLTSYDKSDPQIFKQVAPGLDRAVVSAKRLRKHLADSGAQSPSTDMDQLVEQLLEMRRGL